MSKIRVAFLVPAFNEAPRIGAVIDQIVASGHSCFVVDDNSSDETFDVARTRGAKVLRHPINLGQGAALTTGFRYLQSSGFDYVVTIDGDGQHSVEEALLMVEEAKRRRLQVVLGSRFLSKGKKGIPRIRRLVLFFGIVFTKLHTGLHITDTHNGLRVIDSRALSRFDLLQPRMAHASEILKIISSGQLTWAEFPVTIIYTEETMEKGQQSISGAVEIVADLLLGRMGR